jgi:hypothetical protein
LKNCDLNPPEDKPKPKLKIKLVPFKNSGLKGYYAKEKTMEQRLSSKERRAPIHRWIDDALIEA